MTSPFLSPMTYRKQRQDREIRANAIKQSIVNCREEIDHKHAVVEDCEAQIDDLEEEIERFHEQLKDLENENECLLDAFGSPYPGPGEYGERLLDEQTRTPPPPAYGSPLVEMRPGTSL